MKLALILGLFLIFGLLATQNTFAQSSCVGKLRCENAAGDVVLGSCAMDFFSGDPSAGTFCRDDASQQAACPAGYSYVPGSCVTVSAPTPPPSPGGGTGGNLCGGQVCGSGFVCCNKGEPNERCARNCATADTMTIEVEMTCDGYRGLADVVGRTSHDLKKVNVNVEFDINKFAQQYSPNVSDWSSLWEGDKNSFLQDNILWGPTQYEYDDGNNNGIVDIEESLLFDQCRCSDTRGTCECSINVPPKYDFSRFTLNSSTIIPNSSPAARWWEVYAADACSIMPPSTRVSPGNPWEDFDEACTVCRDNLNYATGPNDSSLTSPSDKRFCHRGYQLTLPDHFKDGGLYKFIYTIVNDTYGGTKSDFISTSTEVNYQCANCSYSTPSQPTFSTNNLSNRNFIVDGDTRIPGEQELNFSWNTIDFGVSDPAACGRNLTLQVFESPDNNSAVNSYNSGGDERNNYDCSGSPVYEDSTVDPANTSYSVPGNVFSYNKDYCVRLVATNGGNLSATSNFLRFSTNTNPILTQAGLSYGNTNPTELNDIDPTYFNSGSNEDNYICGPHNVERTCNSHVSIAELEANGVVGGTGGACWVGVDDGSTTLNAENSAVTLNLEFFELDNLDALGSEYFDNKPNLGVIPGALKLYAVERTGNFDVNNTKILETELINLPGAFSIASSPGVDLRNISTNFSASAPSDGGQIDYRIRKTNNSDPSLLQLQVNLAFTESIDTGTYDIYVGIENSILPELDNLKTDPNVGINYLSSGVENDNWGSSHLQRVGEFQIDADPPTSEISDARIIGSNTFDLTWNASDATPGAGIAAEQILAYCYMEANGSADLNILGVDGTDIADETIANLPTSSIPLIQNCFGNISRALFTNSILSDGQTTGTYSIDLDRLEDFRANIDIADLACNTPTIPNIPVSFAIPDAWNTTSLGGSVWGGSLETQRVFEQNNIFNDDEFNPDGDFVFQAVHNLQQNSEILVEYEGIERMQNDLMQNFVDHSDVLLGTQEGEIDSVISDLSTIQSGIGDWDDQLATPQTFYNAAQANWYQYLREQLNSYPDRYEVLKADLSSIQIGQTISSLSSQCSSDSQCVFEISGPASINATNIVCDVQGLIFVGGSLAINGEISNSNEQNGCVFVVRNGLNIDTNSSTPTYTYDNRNNGRETSDYDIIEGLFLVGGSVNINQDAYEQGNETFIDGLIIRGGILNFGGANHTTAKDLGLRNIYQPSVIYQYDTRYNYFDFNYDLVSSVTGIRSK